MMTHYYEVQLECFNSRGHTYLAERFRYTNKLSAQQKVISLKKHHPSSRVELIKKRWPKTEVSHPSQKIQADDTKSAGSSECLLSALNL